MLRAHRICHLLTGALLALAAWASAHSASAQNATGLTWFVATNGSDAWTGTLREPNASRTDGPFATLDRAQKEMRQHPAQGDGATAGGKSVLVRAGVYFLDHPLRFGPEDSGTEAAQATYSAYPGERVELRGSKTIVGWQPLGTPESEQPSNDGTPDRRPRAPGPSQGHIYRADLAGTDLGTNRFWQLFYKGQRQILARYPNCDPRHPRTGGFLYLTATLDGKTLAPIPYAPSHFRVTGSRTAMQYDPRRLDPGKWSRPTEVRVHVWPGLNWNRSLAAVKSFDPREHVIELQTPVSYALMEGNRCFVENSLEELDAPGEWYYDEASRQLYFRPPDGTNPEGEVSVPVLSELVRFQGDFERKEFVTQVRLQGFTLSESHTSLVMFSMAANCKVACCTFAGCGSTAIRVLDRSHHNVIEGCDIAHVGGSAIVLEEVRDWSHSLENRISYNIISNNHIHHVGESETAVGAIVITPGGGGNVTHDNVICYNLIHDTPHQGISFNGFRNVVEYNHVHHTNLEYSDSGAIGMGSRDIRERGSIIRYNFIHDTGGYSMTSPGRWTYPYFTWGVYLDDYASGVHVYGNIIARTVRGGVKVHGGQDNVIENNIIVDGQWQQIEYDPIDNQRLNSGRWYAHPDKSLWLMTGTKLIGNIFSYRDKKTLWVGARSPKWRQMLAQSDRNLVWHRRKEPGIGLTGEKPKAGSWANWLAMGFDMNSVVADPLFVNPSRDDYRLQPQSPAWTLGFKPIPVERIGLFESPDRASWPVSDDCRRERHLFLPDTGFIERVWIGFRGLAKRMVRSIQAWFSTG